MNLLISKGGNLLCLKLQGTAMLGQLSDRINKTNAALDELNILLIYQRKHKLLTIPVLEFPQIPLRSAL